MIARAGCGLLLWLALLLPGQRASADAPPPRVFAIVVGNNRPPNEDLASLRYADDDALATDELLRQAGVVSLALVHVDAETRAQHPKWTAFGLPRGNDFDRAYQSIRQSIRQSLAAGRPAEFLFFYSGHGDVENGEGVVALEDRRLTRTMLYQLLSDLGASRSHVIIDACKSYFMAYERGPGGKRVRFAGAVTSAVPAELNNTGFILSTSSDRESHEWERYQGGILSHEFRSALRGAADANLDGKIDYEELASFLKTANFGITNPRFRPDFMVRAPGDDFKRALLTWPSARVPLVFDAEGWDHFFVESTQGDRVLDAHPENGQTLFLHVPNELPLFVHREDGRGERVVTAADPLHIGPPKPSTPEIATRDGAAGRAYHKLFAVPFGVRAAAAFAATPRHQIDIGDAHDAPASEMSTLRLLTGVGAVSAAVAGLSLSTAAIGTYLGSAHATQLATANANHTIAVLNRVSVPCYAVAAALAVTTLLWGPWGGTISASAALDERHRVGVSLRVRGAF